jgi:DNA-binding NarL/FixJ family response regulator
VLLIENDAADQVIVKNALMNLDHKVDLNIVPNAEYAIKYLQKSQTMQAKFPKPGLILLDLNMLGLGGKGFLKEIKSNLEFRSIPVVVFSSSDQQEDIDECYKLHAAGFIQKSASLKECNDLFRKLIDYWYPVATAI